MGHTVHAWLESADRSGAALGLAAVADDLLVTSGDNIRLRKDLKKIALIYMWSDDGTYKPVTVSLSAPSIASNPIRLHKGIGLTFLDPSVVFDFRDNPLDMVRPGDNFTATGYEDDEAGQAHYLGVAIIVSDGVIPKGPRPQLTNLHHGVATSANAAIWEQLTITETDGLPAGDYEMYGAIVQHATAFAARFVFKGIEERPAVIPMQNAENPVHPFSEFWGKGYRFTIPDQLPDLELITSGGSGVADITMFLRKVA